MPVSRSKRAHARTPTRLSQRTNSEHRATSCSHARFLRNAIANEATAPSSFEASERID
jgi:hypothetical protein